MKKSLKLLLVGLALLINFQVSAQGRPIHEIHSMMLYNFSKYIKWPENGQAKFVIGVVGNDEVYNTLSQWYSEKTKGAKKFSIVKYNNLDEITKCDILYVSRKASSKFDMIHNKIGNEPTLIVTDAKGLAQKGSGINFKTVNDRLAFELNKASVEGRNLKVSGQLLNIAILI